MTTPGYDLMTPRCPHYRGISTSLQGDSPVDASLHPPGKRVRDIKVDERDVPIRAATGYPGRGSDWSTVYAQIPAIGACLDEAPHFCVARPSKSPVGTGQAQFGRLEFFPRGGVAQLVRATVS